MKNESIDLGQVHNVQKVLSNSPGLVNVKVGLVDSIPCMLSGQVNFFGDNF